MFWTAAAGLFCAMLLLYAAPGRFNLLTCASAHANSANGDGARQIAICEHLCRALSSIDQTSRDETLTRHFGAGQALLEIAQTNDLMLNPKDIGETALWQPPSQRHLPTFELGLAAARAVVTSASLDSLVSLTGRLTGAGAWSTTKALAVPVRSRSWNEVMQP